MANDGGPAFPLTADENNDRDWNLAGGMSLLDYFAGKALPTIMERADVQNKHGWPNWALTVAEMAYDVAAAMVAEKEKRNG